MWNGMFARIQTAGREYALREKASGRSKSSFILRIIFAGVILPIGVPLLLFWLLMKLS
jgi:hypothetical protein